MEGGDELRHRRHGDALGDHRAGGAANGDADDDEEQAAEGRLGEKQRGQDGDRHADHAHQVALTARGRVRQAAQRQDEQDAGDEVEEGGG